MTVKIDFQPEGHIYSIAGRRKLSVSQILELNGNYAFMGDMRSAGKGTEIHKLIERYVISLLTGTPFDDIFDAPKHKEYLEGFKKFMRETGFEPICTELMLYSKKYDYCGTIDLYGKIGKKYVLIDIKTGGLYPVYELQIDGGYGQLLQENDMIYHNAMILQLKPNDYKPHYLHNRIASRACFINNVKVVQWKIEHGVVKL